MNRRDFLKTLVTAAPGAAIAQTALPAKAAITSSAMLWTLKGSFEATLEIAARAGVQSVELKSEHIHWSDADITRVKALCRSFDLGIDTIYGGTPEQGKRLFTMIEPAQREAFLGQVRATIAMARKLEVPQILFLSGKAVAGRTREQQYADLLESAKRAADLCAQANLTVMLEPHSGLFLSTCAEGSKLVREVDNPHFRLLPDTCYAQAEGGNWMESLAQAAPYAAVIHIADADRKGPGTGTIDFAAVYRTIYKSGFRGYVCAEYYPAGDPVASLIRTFNQFRAARPA